MCVCECACVCVCVFCYLQANKETACWLGKNCFEQSSVVKVHCKQGHHTLTLCSHTNTHVHTHAQFRAGPLVQTQTQTYQLTLYPYLGKQSCLVIRCVLVETALTIGWVRKSFFHDHKKCFWRLIMFKRWNKYLWHLYHNMSWNTFWCNHEIRKLSN